CGDLEFRHTLLGHRRLPFPASCMSWPPGDFPGRLAPVRHRIISAAGESLYKKAAAGGEVTLSRRAATTGPPTWTLPEPGGLAALGRNARERAILRSLRSP